MDRELVVLTDQRQQGADSSVLLDRMPQGLIAEDAVLILSPDLLAFNEAPLFQVSDDLLDGSLGDADPCRHGAENHERVLSQQDQDMRVIRQKCPARAILWRRLLKIRRLPLRAFADAIR